MIYMIGMVGVELCRFDPEEGFVFPGGRIPSGTATLWTIPLPGEMPQSPMHQNETVH